MVRKRVFEKRGRDRLYIIAQILTITKDGSLKTQIMYRANLSFAQLNEYLSFLLETKLLKELKREGKTVYETTPKGFRLLEVYEELLSIFAEAGVIESAQIEV